MIKNIFILSIIAEPFLFFTLNDISTTIARILQFLIISILIIKYFFISRVVIKFNNVSEFKPYFYFIIYFLLSILIVTPIYLLNLTQNYPLLKEQFLINQFYIDYFKKFIYELSIYFYYVLYFICLPIVILKKQNDFKFLEYLILILVVLFLIIGFVDYKFQFLCRHLHELINGSCFTVGRRFHSFAGEPRQAAIAIIFLLFLVNYLKIDKFKFISLFLFIALLLTKSFIAYVAIFFSVLIFCLYIIIYNINFKYLLLIASILFFILLISFEPQKISNNYDSRIIDYFFSILNTDLNKDFAKLSYNVRVQIGEIYPFINFTNQIFNFKFLNFIFGNGFFSSAIDTFINFYPSIDSPGNPNSQFIRLTYDFGFIGIYFFIYPFFLFIKRVVKKFSALEIFFYIMLLVICLLQRSSLIFIATGLSISIEYLKSFNNRE